MALKSRIKVFVLLILFSGTFLSVYFLLNIKPVLKVAFLDIGQGDAIFIEGPNGNQVLIDGGPDRSVLRELGKVMPFYDRKIDVVIATHPDSDHIEGLNDVLDRYKVDVFMESGVNAETKIYEGLKSKVKKLESEAKIKHIEVRRGMNIDLGSGAVLEILFPVYDPYFLETNTASIVTRLVYGESEFLFTGDSPKEIESFLVAEDKLGRIELQSDVLKAGHHGSRTSTSEEYLEAVNPEYVVISAGKDNRYGHPHKEVLDILDKFGTKILRTDLSGRIMFESDGLSLKLLGPSF